MSKKLTSSFILIILMMNLFFELFVSHHATNAWQQSGSPSIELNHSVQHNHHAQPDDDHCGNGVCHSGFCKLLNLHTVSHIKNYEMPMIYNSKILLFPESPYLMGNRRPPKTAT